ncbi:radical SAM protein [Nitrosovibrio tenuis]|uniref:Radical SAM superfamily protein n=1 Tax=Nitrosovibrio tenuis TaxID=1233 RepID=A0A1H7LBQ2_9PROT|nr:radical SAM protein [Nitrosovibrio tenuis]SEK95955.1 Radical SAM superfamily protein [Nitrosovibrio tenuis]
MTSAPLRRFSPFPDRHEDWYRLPGGEPRGIIQPHVLDELWFHTGTACNLACPFCLEGSKPGDDRLQLLRFQDAIPFVDEALALGVKQFSFTGGEPFINKDIIRILDYALQHRPCLVLTNATEPLIRRIEQLKPLQNRACALSFRVSLDYPEAARHDAGRGEGMFASALAGLRKLHEMGFHVSVASQLSPGTAADVAAVAAVFAEIFQRAGLPADLARVEFPEFHPPGIHVSTPQITETCMTSYQTEESRRAFMCAFSKMVAKSGDCMKVYACTLVDDDPDYVVGETLTEALQTPVSMKHHRCYSCFKYGASCSEMKRTPEVVRRR